MGLGSFQAFADLLDELGVLGETIEAVVHLVAGWAVPERTGRGHHDGHVTENDHESERDEQRRVAVGSRSGRIIARCWDAETSMRRRGSRWHLEQVDEFS